MILSAVMDEIGDALESIPGLRVYRWPAEQIAVPAAIVLYPEVIELNEAFQRGLDRMTTGIRVVTGRIWDRSTRDAMSVYCDGDSTTSVMGAIYGHTFTSCSFCHVTEIRFAFDHEIAGVPYLATEYTLDVAGPGAQES